MHLKREPTHLRVVGTNSKPGHQSVLSRAPDAPGSPEDLPGRQITGLGFKNAKIHMKIGPEATPND